MLRNYVHARTFFNLKIHPPPITLLATLPAASLLPQRGRGCGHGMIPRGRARGGGQGGRGQQRHSASWSPNTREPTDEDRRQDNGRPWHHQQNRGRGGACRRGRLPHRR